MKRNVATFTAVATSLVLLPLAAMPSLPIVACATGPTPEQQARRAQTQTELQAAAEARRVLAEERRRRLLEAQEELLQDAPGRALTAGDRTHAAALLATLNSLVGRTLQTDSVQWTQSEIKENPFPPFSLEVATGRLTLHLTATRWRELLLRHVTYVLPWDNTTTITILDNPPIISHNYIVNIDTKGHENQELIRSVDDDATSWKAMIRINTSDAKTAAKIRRALEELVDLYNP